MSPEPRGVLNYSITQFFNSPIFPILLSVDRDPVHTVRRIQHSLGQGWVGVDGPHQICDGGFEFQGGDGFGDQFGGLRANDVYAENLAIVGVGDDLDEALVLGNDWDGGGGCRGGGEVELV